MSVIDIRTAIPGPNSILQMNRREQHVARGPFHVTPVFVAAADASTITDIDGNTFIDLAAGIGVANIGHCPEKVVEAINCQAQKYLHTGFNVVPYQGYTDVCESLNRLAPGNFLKKTFLANSGAEAVENAIKIARAHTGKSGIVCFDHAFHGRTYMSMALTAKENPYRNGFGPFPEKVYRVPFPYLYRSSKFDTCDQFSKYSFDQFSEVLSAQVDIGEVAAIIIEPVLGEGGFIPVPLPFWRLLRRFCDSNDILLIADEVQTGFGRTGKLFASEHFDSWPDLITLAKGLGGGLPISAVVGRADVMDAVAVGGIGGTFNGNALSCAAALAVIDEMENGVVLANARRVAEVLNSRLRVWKSRFESVGDVRGLGPMIAMELVVDKVSKRPATDLTKALLQYAHQHGVILMSAGSLGNVVRFLPPLTIALDVLKEGLDVIERGLELLGSKNSERGASPTLEQRQTTPKGSAKSLGVTTSAKHTIDGIIERAYEVLAFEPGSAPRWEAFSELFVDRCLLALRVFPTDSSVRVMNMQEYMMAQMEHELQDDGYSESPGDRTVSVSGDIAWVYQNFTMNFKGRDPVPAVDVFSLVKGDGDWKIVSVISDMQAA